MITWQLWVACGIMLGLVANIAIAAIAESLNIETDDIVKIPSIDHTRAMQFILGAPLVPSVALLVAVYFCYESPRFYMRPEDPSNFNPQEALRILKAIRATEVGINQTHESAGVLSPGVNFHVAAASDERLDPDPVVDETG